MTIRNSPQPDVRQIRVFISSTFRDMKEDRDYLVKFTFPQLRKLCEQRGVTWGEVDLRWGVTDEQKAEGKVLPICLEEIHRCRPYFIGLLGERYGWITDAIPPEILEREPWLREHLQSRTSVTELEILHGVLREETLHEHAYFYFRNSEYVKTIPPEKRPDFTTESTEHNEKLQRLKNQIRHARDEQVCQLRENYRDPEELGRWVLEDFTALIDGLFPDVPLDPLDRDAVDHDAFAASRAKVYIGRQEYFDRLDAHAAGDGPPLIVLGESGSGKSALLANWARRYRAVHPNELLLVHFIGATPYSSDWAAMLWRIMGEFKRRLGITQDIPDKPDALRAAFANWLHLAAANGRVVLMLDALNQLEDRNGAPDLVWLPPVIPGNVRLILSTLPGRPFDDLKKRPWPTLEVKPLDPAERRQLIHDYLAQYTKALNTARMERIASAPQTANPLYLRSLLEELRLFGEHQGLDERISHYLAAQTIPGLYERILERYEQDYERDRPGLVRDAMSLLWASRHGLSEAEILELLRRSGEQRLPQAVWSPLFLAAEQSLVSRSGLIGFAHVFLRNAVADRYLASSPSKRRAHLQLAGYFARPPEDVPDSAHPYLLLPYGPRVCEEFPWQLKEAEQWACLHAFLCDWNLFLSLFATRQYELLGYWLTLGDRFDIVASYTAAMSQWLPEIAKKGSWAKTMVLTAVSDFFCLAGRIDGLEAIAPEHSKAAEDDSWIADALTRMTQAEVCSARGDWQQEELKEREILDLFPDSFGSDDAAMISTRKNLAKTLIGLQKVEEAQQIYGELITDLEKQRGKDDPELLSVMHDLAHLHQKRGDFPQAISLFRETMERQERILGTHHPKTMSTASCLAIALHKSGQSGEAESLLRTALEQTGHTLGTDHPQALHAALWLARVCHSMGKRDDAERLLRGSLAGAERRLGSDQPATLAHAYQLARVLADSGNECEAETLFRRVLESLARREMLDYEGFAESLFELCKILQKKGDSEALADLHQFSLMWMRKHLGPEAPETLEAAGVQAEILSLKGDIDAAEKLYRATLTGWEHSGNASAAEARSCMEGLADVLIRKGNEQEAFLLYSRLFGEMEVEHETRGP
jgi:nephrocystin-3